MNQRDETRQLIHELLDGTLDKAGFTELQEILLRDEEARQDYYRLMTTDQLLVDNYEQPDHLAAHGHSAESPWAARRMRGRPLLWSLGAAAVILLTGLTTLMMIRTNSPPVTLSSSADTRFLIEGRASDNGIWEEGEALEVKDGVMVARLNRSTEACIEGPASLTLLDGAGDLELHHGKVYFRVAPGAPDFKVHVAGATVRHIGTQFGVRATGHDSCEVHVASGSVEIDRLDGQGPTALAAGEAAAWVNDRPTGKLPLDMAGFQQSLPSEFLVFADDFSEPEGTRLSGKKPDVGHPWMVLSEKHPTVAGGGKLDTSGGFRDLSSNFRIEATTHHRRVLLLTFSTAQPATISDKVKRQGGTEGITLWSPDGRAICSVVARAKEGHRWRLRDEASGRESELTRLSALDPHDLTLRYDPAGGKISLHAGASAQAETIAEVTTRSDATASSLTVSNDDGGDLALTRLAVRIVNYAGKPGSAR